MDFSEVSEAEQKFRQFHAANPRVYETLVRLSREALARGRRKIGIKMLIEVVRWEIWLTTSDEDFKINNNYAPRYARLMMEKEPDLAGVFNLRGMHE